MRELCAQEARRVSGDCGAYEPHGCMLTGVGCLCACPCGDAYCARTFDCSCPGARCARAAATLAEPAQVPGGDAHSDRISLQCCATHATVREILRARARASHEPSHEPSTCMLRGEIVLAHPLSCMCQYDSRSCRWCRSCAVWGGHVTQRAVLRCKCASPIQRRLLPA